VSKARIDCQEASASVKVVARIRPRLSKEAHFLDGVEASLDRRSVVLNPKQGDKKTFAFDQVFDARETHGSQLAIFDSFGRELVNQSLTGYNVCVFAYGHTGTGKSYTMLGDGAVAGSSSSAAHAGLIPRCLRAVFQAHRQQPQSHGHRYSCEYYEVYNEQIKDLLQPARSQRTRKVHVHPKHGVRVENLTISVVQSADDALSLLEFGNQMRAVAATTMNARSSRSHAIFTFRHERLGQSSEADSQGCQSTMTFVDLAGKEDQSASKNQAMQFREMCAINTSLFHLARLISKLSEGSARAERSLSDFRNSKLTLLLSPALVGNSRTALVATMAPSQCYFEDSLSTCSFASSVKRVKTRPAVNNKSNTALVVELEAEVRLLQVQLAEKETNQTETVQELKAAQVLIASYQKSWEETVAKSEELQMNRKKSLTSLGLNFPVSPDFAREAAVVPFFTKLCDDPPLQGRCNYFLQKTALRIGSDEASCDIVLKGLGIAPHMCEVVWDQSSQIEIKLLCVEAADAGVPRVLVAGRPLSLAKATATVSHGDCIFLGYSHAFRLVAPGFDEVAKCSASDALTLARETIANLDVASAVAEVTDEAGAQFKQIVPFIRHLGARSSEEVVRNLLDALHRVCPLIDEANLITQEVFGERITHFQLHALTNIFDFTRDVPELVVCVLKHATKQSTPMAAELGLDGHMTIGGTEPLQYVWSLEKFLCRLRAMREIYQDSFDSSTGVHGLLKRLSGRPFEDPWSELPLSEAQLSGDTSDCSLLGKRGSLSHWFSRQSTSMPSSRSADTPQPESPVTASDEATSDTGYPMICASEVESVAKRDGPSSNVSATRKSPVQASRLLPSSASDCAKTSIKTERKAVPTCVLRAASPIRNAMRCSTGTIAGNVPAAQFSSAPPLSQCKRNATASPPACKSRLVPSCTAQPTEAQRRRATVCPAWAPPTTPTTWCRHIPTTPRASSRLLAPTSASTARANQRSMQPPSTPRRSSRQIPTQRSVSPPAKARASSQKCTPSRRSVSSPGDRSKNITPKRSPSPPADQVRKGVPLCSPRFTVGPKVPLAPHRVAVESPIRAALDNQANWMFAEVQRLHTFLSQMHCDQSSDQSSQPPAQSSTAQSSSSSSSGRAAGSEDVTPPLTARRARINEAPAETREPYGVDMIDRLAEMKKQAENAKPEVAKDVMRKVNDFHAELVETLKTKLERKMHTLNKPGRRQESSSSSTCMQGESSSTTPPLSGSDSRETDTQSTPPTPAESVVYRPQAQQPQSTARPAQRAQSASPKPQPTFRPLTSAYAKRDASVVAGRTLDRNAHAAPQVSERQAAVVSTAHAAPGTVARCAPVTSLTHSSHTLARTRYEECASTVRRASASPMMSRHTVYAVPQIKWDVYYEVP